MSDDVSPKFGTDTTPSVIDQAKARGWTAGIFSFGKAEEDGIAYFNCGLVERPDGLWLIVRRAMFDRYDNFGMNTVWAFKLGDDLSPIEGVKLKFLKSEAQEHFEDPRAFHFGGQTWVACCTFLWYGNGEWTGAHQTLATFSTQPGEETDWTCQRRFNPEIGGNAAQVDARGQKHEKNWLWFVVEDDRSPKMGLLYHSKPWRIALFRTRLDGQSAETFEYENGVSWNFGDIRGGTPPVLVDGVYWTFFHSSIPWIGRFRRYYMGVCGFDSKPPFKPIFLSRKPLLVGNQTDPWGPKKPLVVFPCGALIKNGEWLVTFGVNDIACGWLRVPHWDITALAKPVPTHEDAINLLQDEEEDETLLGGGDAKCNAPVDSDPIRPVAESASVQSMEQCSNGAEIVQPSSAPAITLGDEIRYHVSSLRRLENGQRSRHARILSELRKHRLVPGPRPK